MVADFQNLLQTHVETFLHIDRCVAARNDGIDKIFSIDKNSIVGASLSGIRFHFVRNDPMEINIVYVSEKEIFIEILLIFISFLANRRSSCRRLEM